MFRILFVILAAAVITFSAIILGNYLQKKIADVEAILNTSEPADEQITSRPKLDSPASQRSVSAAGLNLRDYHTEDEVVAAVNLLAEHYDTLLVRVTSSDGRLLYTSPALCETMRMALPETDDALALVRSAISAAKSKNLCLCAVMDSSFGLLDPGIDALTDGIVFGELASFGVDEILIENTIIDTENIPADDIALYLSECREVTKNSCELGVLIPDDVFLTFSNARSIQTIASAADFTGIDMTSYSAATPDEMYTRMTQDITSLYGSFSIYNMRVVLSTLDSDLLAAQYQALSDSGITNICFTETVLPDALNYNGSDEIPEETEEPGEDPSAADQSPQAEPESNPYATTGDGNPTEDPETAPAPENDWWDSAPSDDTDDYGDDSGDEGGKRWF